MADFKNFLGREPVSNYDILKSYFSGEKISTISAETGKSTGEIYRILKRHNVSPNRLKSKHGQVLGLAKGGLNTGQISNLTGYSRRNVRYILSNEIRNGNL